jgi:hypothetical protein
MIPARMAETSKMTGEMRKIKRVSTAGANEVSSSSRKNEKGKRRTVRAVCEPKQQQDRDGTDSHRYTAVDLHLRVEEPEVLAVHEEDDSATDRVSGDEASESHLGVRREVRKGTGVEVKKRDEQCPCGGER